MRSIEWSTDLGPNSLEGPERKRPERKNACSRLSALTPLE